MAATHAAGASSFILLEFADLPSAGRALAQDCAGWIAAALAQKGSAFFAAPGGKSPGPFFEALGNADLDWSKVTVTLTDERFVPEESGESNAGLLRRTFLRGPAQAARFLAPMAGAATLSEAAIVWDSALRAAPDFDAVVLGMGEDGHFASLFPGSAALAEGLDPTGSRAALAVDDRSPQRLTLTLRALLRSKRLTLLIAGEPKRAIFAAIARNDPDALKLPIASLLRQSPAPPVIYWGAHS